MKVKQALWSPVVCPDTWPFVESFSFAGVCHIQGIFIRYNPWWGLASLKIWMPVTEERQCHSEYWIQPSESMISYPVNYISSEWHSVFTLHCPWNTDKSFVHFSAILHNNKYWEPMANGLSVTWCQGPLLLDALVTGNGFFRLSFVPCRHPERKCCL